GGHLGRLGHDRGRHRRGRPGRTHLSRPGDGEQSAHFRRCDSSRSACPAGRFCAGMPGEALASTMKARAHKLFLVGAILCVLGACSSRSERIVIGSKNFTESLILGELMAQQIEAHSALKVERRFYLAGTYICQQAMLSGRIDVYPEYTGTALTAILKERA